ncbi:MAG: flagella basal body P-ring formation protein FlgA [Bryobacterales bacterium]|nr:flagella basal body P-ring formation protein FlgA [Bryobacterales bacterium]
MRTVAAIAMLAVVALSSKSATSFGPTTSPGSTSSSQPCLAVRGARVLAGELAGQDKRFASLAADYDLGYVPAPGTRRVLLAPLHGDVSPEQSLGAGALESEVCIKRVERQLTRDQIAAALELPGFGAVSAEIVAWQEGLFPEGRLRMPATGIVPPARGAREVIWRGLLEFEPGRSVALWARARLGRETPCARWKHAVRRGQPADVDALEHAPCDAAAIVNGVLPGLAEAAPGGSPRVLVRNLPAGAWLQQDQLTQEPVLRRGERASLTVRSGGVSLALPVETEQAGAVGERIWVRSVAPWGAGSVAHARKRVRALVTGPGQLRLDADASANGNR